MVIIKEEALIPCHDVLSGPSYQIQLPFEKMGGLKMVQDLQRRVEYL